MRSWMKLSLRARLVSLYLGLLFLSILVLSGYSYLDVRRLLIYNTAIRLRAQAKPVIEQWLFPGKSGASHTRAAAHVPRRIPKLASIARPLACDLTSRDTAALILDRNGKKLANGKRLPEEPSPPLPDPAYYRKALAGKNEVDYIMKENEKLLLVLLIPLRAGAGKKEIMGVAQISTSLVPVHRIMVRHGIVLVLIAVITLLAGGITAFLLISTALNGLRQMAHTCRMISEGDLSQRVNLPHHRDEIGSLADAFDHTVERIEATFESQRRFVANAAHELRTPLTALRGSMEVLLRGAQDDPAAVTRLTQGMYREVLRLSRLCEQLLDLTRLDVSSNINKQEVNLDEFFEGFLQQATILGRDHRVTLEKGPFVLVSADRDMLEQVMFNLLHNAVRHSRSGETITLGWRLVPNHVKIWVEDHGEGIPPRDLPHIFEPFYRGVSRVYGNERGTGLGLTLAKAVVEAHGGRITVESRPGKGTIVAFLLPLN
ncbi:MAG: HAMP domain-containing histidine kinase [Thermoplasmata archaeon]|nr:MAG: HAMP domain-containing histidine kinase [Deltaproteobacteria bacterium]RLF59711.1 MAG: HAMP domain-containing histidine kinase [Thermoplasmata archaeon]HDZ89516.1 sensor histidine kinase [Deltaproteobacteria bacterium]